MNATRTDRAARRESPGDVVQAIAWTPLDAPTRALAIDMVRKAVGGSLTRPLVIWTPYGRVSYPSVKVPNTRALKRAVITTADMLAHPATTAARAAALAIPTNGTMQPFAAPPDSWTAREHETRVIRNRKRVSTFERQRVAMAPVIGDRYETPYWWDTTRVDALTIDERRHLSADLVALAPHRLRDGAVGLDVQRVTDKHLARHDVPRLVGSDPTAWHYVRRIDRSDVVTTASSHRANLDGRRFRSALVDLEPFDGAYGTRTIQREVLPTRTTLRLSLRKGERGNVVHAPRLRTVADGAPTLGVLLGYAACLVQLTELVAPWSSPRFIWRGHYLSARPGKSRSVRSTRRGKRAQIKQANDERTDGEYERPDTLGGYMVIAESTERGKRNVIVGDQYRATITRQDKPNGRFSVNVRDHGVTWSITARTPNRVAHHLFTRDATTGLAQSVAYWQQYGHDYAPMKG